ncbi:MAG TPA: tellurite resistance/C4-dicarboxylate transporter family protein [Anaeromyxobacteraceae bacterium]|nr:tellurite resistance/C4-dicarboxylate transporter family protein [Anaeromyxobacteraceae bacterium]
MDSSAPIADRSSGPVAYVARGIQELHPAYFALVMATGIVSISAHTLELEGAARLLFWINVPAYCVIVALFVTRALLYPKQLASDLHSHQRGPGFFTSVAATCVLGLQFVLLRGEVRVGYVLWWVGITLWAACTYGIFVLLSIRETKPTLGEGINGGWLLAVVSTQSVVVLGCKVLPAHFPNDEVLFLFLASLWMCGGMLYIWMISLIFYRYMFFRFSRSDLLPPYWINMGAVAISVVAGTSLSATTPDSPLLQRLLPFVNGLTVMFWATATWWIPMLVLLGIWRHRGARVRITYDPLYWGLVFPLGMYSLCTYRLGQLFAVPALLGIARTFAVVALCAWLLTFLGMTARVLRLVVLAVRALQPARSAVGSQPGSS